MIKVYSTAYNKNSYHVRACVLCAACVPLYCHMRAKTLLYVGPNTVYCPRTTKLSLVYLHMTYDKIRGTDRDIRPAYSCR